MRINVKYFTIKIAFLLMFIHIPVSDTRATEKSRQRLNIESNSIQRQLPETDLYQDSKALKRVFLSNRTVTCNDGSKAGFYLRKSQGSRRWVVFFEGGWHCYDTKSCRARWMKLRQLMTSAHWPETRNVGGILSPHTQENPYWHDANHVFVPYCSSDSWSGTRVKPEPTDGLRFMGSLIVRQVIADLIPLGLGHSQGADLLMAGSSAGGLGVMLNLDNIKNFLQVEKGLRVNVRGVTDSGWFLDRAPYTPGAVAASEAVRQGWKLWNGALPPACVAEHPGEPWKCYFGHRLYNTLQAPLFVFQWLFDEAQMRADSVGAPVTPQQWDYIHDMGKALRASLDNVTAVFAPSCIGHSVLTKRDWLDIKIDDISLSDAIRCWAQVGAKDKHLKRRAPNKLSKEEREERKRRKIEGEKKQKRKLTKEERELKKFRRQERRERKRRLREEQRQLAETSKAPRTGRSSNRNRIENKSMPKIIENEHQGRRRQRNGTNHHRHERNNQRKRLNSHHNNNNNNNRNKLSNPNNNNKNINTNSNNNNNNRKLRLDIPEPKKCTLRLLERCSWPQCNHSCPTLTNPMTGEEMKFLELLASFGLDMQSVAAALGIDMHTLNNMDHTELVNLLTQQVS